VMGRVFRCLSTVTGLNITVLMAPMSLTAVRHRLLIASLSCTSCNGNFHIVFSYTLLCMLKLLMMLYCLYVDSGSNTASTERVYS